MAAKRYASLPTDARRNVREMPRPDRRKNFAARGFPISTRCHHRQNRRGPQGVGRKKQRRHAPQLRRQPPHGPRCQPNPQPPATRVMNDCCSSGKCEAGTAPASKEARAATKHAAITDGFKAMEKSPRFDRQIISLLSSFQMVCRMMPSHQTAIYKIIREQQSRGLILN